MVMGKDYQTIVAEMENRLAMTAKQYYSEFYIGITDDIERSLEEHALSKGWNWYISQTAVDTDTARRVEKYFLDKGMRGKKKEKDKHSTIVYCYAVTPLTIE